MSNIHEVPSDETFAKYPVIDRRSYSEHLTNFLNSKAESGYVLNLNAEWGAGKTTFLQCWYNELKKDHPVVYFDAWKSDFTHDAMLALLEAFHSQLMCAVTENKELLNKLMEGGKHFVKSTAWRLVVGFIKRQGGMEANDDLFSSISEELKELGLEASDLTDSLQDTFGAMVDQKKKVEGVHNFKQTLIELSETYLAVHNDKTPPIYVLIDELDRCRPTYAIEVIESVKHFFNTQSFVFVLATDTKQLQHSIKAVYGEGFDSSSYLSRFFDRTATLSAPTLKEYIAVELEKIFDPAPEHYKHYDIISRMINWHGISSLREVKKILNDVEVASTQNKSYRILHLIALSILRQRFPDFYNNLRARNWPPYNNRHGNSDMNRIIQASNSTPNIKLSSHQSRISLNDFLYNLSMTLTPNPSIDENTFHYQYRNVDLTNITTNLSLVVESYSHLYLANSHSQELANKEDYFTLLDFAGYITDVR
ncbi:hypothetical protein SKP08_002712 [Vibrio fluvialis]|uniref:KAP family P-loop NTPase fold protein n=1 Tax=Vibrio fluvialis TaxID=676 RepID=UPI0013027CDB|nr:P-loop NTPase fold protein [Vibrio fluvialis]EKO3514174.1 hypothetical protein [Vibrio fluvialis]ELX7502632.1 hypothetical protein [Vibrio fluvialis]